MSGLLIEIPNALRAQATDDTSWTKDVELDELTGDEEDILTDQTRAAGGKGVLARSASRRITEVLSRCTVSLGGVTRPEGKTRKTAPLFFEKQWHRAYTSDRSFAMIRLRQISLGDDYTFEATCPSCKKGIPNIHHDLAALEVKTVPLEEASQLTRTVTLPRSGDKVTYRMLTGEDEQYIQDVLKTRKSDYLSALLARRIVGVVTTSEDPVPPPIEYLKGMRQYDRRFFSAEADKHEGGVDTEIKIVCDECHTEFLKKLDMGDPAFFFPSEI